MKPAEHHQALDTVHADAAKATVESGLPEAELVGGGLPGGAERSTIVVPGNGPVGVKSEFLTASVEDGPKDHVGHHIVTYDQLPEVEKPRVHLFFQIYYLMTGLHVLHVLIGMSLITWIYVRASKGHFSKKYNVPVDLVGLYWHLVDLIWIFLFPLLYLIH